MPHVLIAGGGLVGSVNACLFGRRGWKVTVFESRSDPRGKDIENGKSINLALGFRALSTLDQLGLKEKVIDLGVAIRERVCYQDGRPPIRERIQTLKDGDFILTINRHKLSQLLINEAEKYENVKFLFNHKATKFDVVDKMLVVETLEKSFPVDGDLILACDGAHSSVRRSLLKVPGFGFSQRYIDIGYMDLSVKVINSSDFKLGVHYSWRKENAILVALLNRDQSLTVFEESFSNPKGASFFFENLFSDVYRVLGEKHIENIFSGNKAQAIINVQCSQHSFFDKLLLMGDSAHAMVPFQGQGVNCGFEDCVVLDEILDDFGERDLMHVARKYSTLRTKETNIMNNMEWAIYSQLLHVRFNHLLTMADRINMSLDDIIKRDKKVKTESKAGTSNGNNSNKNAGSNKPSGAKRNNNNRRAPPAKNARVALANKVLKKSKAIAARRAAGAGAQRRSLGARGKPVPAAGLSTVATKKLVNKLVKNALRKRTNITTAQVVRKRGGVAASTLAARRTQAIRKNIAAARNAVLPVRTVIQQRPISAPIRTVVQHVQQPPVRVIRQVITAPPLETQVIRRGPPQQQIRRGPPQQQIRRVHPQQQQRRNVVVQHVQQGRRFRQGNNNNRRDDRPTVIHRQVVQQVPRRIPQYAAQVVQRVVQAPAPPQRHYQQPQRFQQQPQRIQQQPMSYRRPQQGGNVRYVNAGGRQAQRNTVVRQVQPVQYRPVQYVTDSVVTSRGRGFRAF
ncbi:hypothetical protein CAEBREN_11191 [Caenorhabditis brenneri]|uniref:FAD-binding domain-containing protein n=1 Tax=Caenorhabditis brenneri TaxID=135651 RepID=G0NGU3_CAEBE|nr:hypothetical protein CAEBREN_11191 [Caenorhabditis brenneri]